MAKEGKSIFTVIMFILFIVCVIFGNSLILHIEDFTDNNSISIFLIHQTESIIKFIALCLAFCVLLAIIVYSEIYLCRNNKQSWLSILFIFSGLYLFIKSFIFIDELLDIMSELGEDVDILTILPFTLESLMLLSGVSLLVIGLIRLYKFPIQCNRNNEIDKGLLAYIPVGIGAIAIFITSIYYIDEDIVYFDAFIILLIACTFVISGLLLRIVSLMKKNK